MDPQPAFTFQDLFRFVIGDMAQAVAEREGETRDEQFARCQAAVHTIMGFQPRDVIEVMLAGHCVMLHEVMTANVRTALRADATPARRGPDGSVVAVNKAFNDNLDRLARYRQRPAEGARDAPAAPPRATPDDAMPARTTPGDVTPARATSDDAVPPATTPEPPQPARPVMQGMNRAARRQAARAETRAAAAASRAAPKSSPGASSPVRRDARLPDSAHSSASPAEIAACQANPEAMAALRSGDALGFARAMGIEQPSAAFMEAAATAGSPFDLESSGPWPADTSASAAKA